MLVELFDTTVRVGTMEITGAHGERGAGCVPLVLAVELRELSSFAIPPIIQLRATIRVERDVVAGSDEATFDLRAAAASHGRNAQFRFLLTHDQMNALDRARGDSARLELGFEFDGMILASNVAIRVAAAANYAIPASVWGEILRDAGYEERLTIEIPLKGGRIEALGPEAARAGAALANAAAKLRERGWAEALRFCRDAFDALEPLRDSSPPLADWGNATTRTGWSPRQRFAAAEAAIRHTTHAGAHGAIGTPAEDEARAAVAYTAIMLRRYVERSMV